MVIVRFPLALTLLPPTERIGPSSMVLRSSACDVPNQTYKLYSRQLVFFYRKKVQELILVNFRVLLIPSLRPWELLFILSLEIVQWPLGPVNSTSYDSSNLSSTLNLSHCVISGPPQT